MYSSFKPYDDEPLGAQELEESSHYFQGDHKEFYNTHTHTLELKFRGTRSRDRFIKKILSQQLATGYASDAQNTRITDGSKPSLYSPIGRNRLKIENALNLKARMAEPSSPSAEPSSRNACAEQKPPSATEVSEHPSLLPAKSPNGLAPQDNRGYQQTKPKTPSDIPILLASFTPSESLDYEDINDEGSSGCCILM